MRADFILFAEHCAAFQGKRMHLQEALSTNGVDFNRHFTSFSAFVLTLSRANWRISGGRLMLNGTDETYYEIGADQLVTFRRLGDAEYEFIEKCGPTVFRRTTLKLLSF